MIFKLTTRNRGSDFALAVEDERNFVTQISPYRVDSDGSAARWAKRMLDRRINEVLVMMQENGLVTDDCQLQLHPDILRRIANDRDVR